MIHILFLCLGNICRSPMAEAIFRDLVKQEALSDRIEVDSAGLGPWHAGKAPHEGTRDILDNQQISYEGIVARELQTEDFSSIDYLIAMDEQNIQALEAFDQAHNDITVAKLMDFTEDADEADVPDPYITGHFDYTYELVSEGCQALLDDIRKKYDL